MRYRSSVAPTQPGDRRVIRSLLTAVLAIGVATPCLARDGDFASGAMLAKACTSRSAGESSLCDGYIAGALDTVAAGTEFRGTICVPPATKLSALREAMAHYAPGHVDQTKTSGVALLAAMIKAQYPCPAK